MSSSPTCGPTNSHDEFRVQAVGLNDEIGQARCFQVVPDLTDVGRFAVPHFDQGSAGKIEPEIEAANRQRSNTRNDQDR